MRMQSWMFLLLLLAGGSAASQVSLGIQVPPAGVVQKSQLWNMVLINGSSATYNVDVTLTLISTADNNPVLTVVSRNLTLGKGAHQLKYSDLAPFNYRFTSPAFGTDMRPEGLLPVGSYTACYTVTRWTGDLPEPLTEDCISLEVQALSPPVLNTPADKDTIQTDYPQFTWMPASPVNLFADLAYELVLVKVLPDQSPLQAIQQNIPVFNQPRLRQPFFNLPAGSTGIDTGNVYAWSIVAKNSNQFIAMSDVFTFTRKAAPVAESPAAVSNAYVQLNRGEDGAAVATSGNLRVIYPNLAGDASLSYTITNLSDKSNGVVNTGTLALTPGNNFIEADIKRGSKLEAGNTYQFTAVNSRGEKWTLKFIYQKK